MIAGRLSVTINLLYGRSTLPVRPPAGCVPTVIQKRAMPVLAEPRAAVERALAEPVDSPSLRLHPHLRHHPAGPERPVSALADPHPARRGCPARGHHDPGRDGAPSPER